MRESLGAATRANSARLEKPLPNAVWVGAVMDCNNDLDDAERISSVKSTMLTRSSADLPKSCCDRYALPDTERASVTVYLIDFERDLSLV